MARETIVESGLQYLHNTDFKVYIEDLSVTKWAKPLAKQFSKSRNLGGQVDVDYLTTPNSLNEGGESHSELIK